PDLALGVRVRSGTAQATPEGGLRRQAGPRTVDEAAQQPHVGSLQCAPLVRSVCALHVNSLRKQSSATADARLVSPLSAPRSGIIMACSNLSQSYSEILLSHSRPKVIGPRI